MTESSVTNETRTRKQKLIPPVDELKRLFSYDPETGVLSWRPRYKKNGQVMSRYCKQCGKLDRRGYLVVGVQGQSYYAHRIIWKMITSDEPPAVDHVDGLTNATRNLRAATKPQNSRNRKRSKDKALPKGVYRCRDRFRARIRAGGLVFSLGNFPTVELAHAAYKAAGSTLHMQFARFD